MSVCGVRVGVFAVTLGGGSSAKKWIGLVSPCGFADLHSTMFTCKLIGIYTGEGIMAITVTNEWHNKQIDYSLQVHIYSARLLLSNSRLSA